MKKILLSLLSVTPIVLNAQITIVQGDLPTANTLWVNAQDTGYTGAIPAGGASQSWNYASLQNTQTDSTTFLDAAGTPYAAQFPGSNLVVMNGNATGYIYYTASSTGFAADGVADPTSGLVLHFNPARLTLPVPFTYLNSLVHMTRLQIDTSYPGPPPVNARIVQVTQQTFDADGYGSLQLPNGNFPSTLRIKDTDHSYDSLYVDFGFGYTLFGNPTESQTTNYSWVRNGPGALLLQINSDSLGTLATGGAIYLLSSGPTAITENIPVNLKNAYPNPSSSFVSVDLSNFNGQAEILYVYDITGRQMDAMNIQNIDRNTFDVRQYENGRYLMRITGRSMQPVTGSFTVVH